MKSYVMMLNAYNGIGISPFITQGYYKVLHSMHKNIEIGFNDSENVIMLIFLIKNYLDCVNAKIILPTNELDADMLHP